MDQLETSDHAATRALLESEIEDLEAEIARWSAPFHASWRLLATLGCSSLVALATFEFYPGYYPELPSVLAMLIGIVVFGLLLSAPERRRRRELEARLAEARQAREELGPGGSS